MLHCLLRPVELLLQELAPMPLLDYEFSGTALAVASCLLRYFDTQAKGTSSGLALLLRYSSTRSGVFLLACQGCLGHALPICVPPRRV